MNAAPPPAPGDPAPTVAPGDGSPLRRSDWTGRVALLFVLVSLAALVIAPLLVQRAVERVRESIEEQAEPGRTLVTRLQFSLAREMSALRGYLLTGSDAYLDVYAEALENELRAYEELEPIAALLGPEVLEHFVATRTLSTHWHERAREDEIVAQRRASGTPMAAALISVEQETYERTLRATSALDSAIVRASVRGRARIRDMERTGFRINVALGILALGAAIAVARLEHRTRRYAVEAERRRQESEEALARLRRATESRARLVRGVTHDVKNPLSAALGYVELLEMEIKGPLSPAQALMVAGVRRSIDASLSIIGDLLDVARAEGGALAVNRVPVDVGALASRLCDDHRAMAEAASHTLELAVEGERIEVETDPERVSQVIGNLISNAIKYTPSPGRITLRVRPATDQADRPGRWVAICVEDTGPGIPVGQRDSIFDEFTRLPGAGETTGHGLGLAISRRIARLLDGDITVGDSPAGGAAFTLWIPAST